MRPGRLYGDCSAVLITASPTASNIVATITNARTFMRKMLSWGVGSGQSVSVGRGQRVGAWIKPESARLLIGVAGPDLPFPTGIIRACTQRILTTAEHRMTH